MIKKFSVIFNPSEKSSENITLMLFLFKTYSVNSKVCIVLLSNRNITGLQNLISIIINLSNCLEIYAFEKPAC